MSSDDSFGHSAKFYPS